MGTRGLDIISSPGASLVFPPPFSFSSFIVGDTIPQCVHLIVAFKGYRMTRYRRKRRNLSARECSATMSSSLSPEHCKLYVYLILLLHCDSNTLFSLKKKKKKKKKKSAALRPLL